MVRNIKGIIVLFLFSILSVFVYSQNDYKISTYKKPDIKRQSLGFGLSSNGGLSTTNIINIDPSLNRDGLKSNLSGRVSANYNYYRYSERYIGILNANMTTYGGHINDARLDGSSQNLNSLSGELFLNSENNFYFSPKYFFKLNGSINYYTSTQNLSSEELDVVPIIEENQKNKKLETDLHIGIGYGRIEYVTDAQHAFFIITELKEIGVIEEDISSKQLEQLAIEITKIKNKRVLDSRLKKIDELKQMDRVLRELGIIKTEDISYFTQLNDSWNYGSLNLRREGFEYQMFFSPKFYRNYDLDNDYSDIDPYIDYYMTQQSIFNYSVGAQANYYKNISNYWQFALGADLRLEDSFVEEYILAHHPDTIANDLRHLSDMNLRGRINMNLGYYPNSRTHFDLSYYLYSYMPFDEYSATSFDFNNSIKFEANYYISPQISINGKINLSDYYENYREEWRTDKYRNDFRMSYLIGLSYTLF